jgi:hypothetical protein
MDMTAYPPHWRPGQLLDLKRYSDGHFEATLLGERAEADGSNVVIFPSGYDAQQFTSAWYGTPEMRAQMYPKPRDLSLDPEANMIEYTPVKPIPPFVGPPDGTLIDLHGHVSNPPLNRAERRKLRLGKA